MIVPTATAKHLNFEREMTKCAAPRFPNPKISETFLDFPKTRRVSDRSLKLTEALLGLPRDIIDAAVREWERPAYAHAFSSKRTDFSRNFCTTTTR